MQVRLTARLKNQNELIRMIEVGGEKLAGSIRVAEGRESWGSLMSASNSEVFAR
jgi:hypothetical protein